MSRDIISEYWDVKSQNKKWQRSKKSSKQDFKKCIVKTSQNQTYELNLNKNKNWKVRKDLEQQIDIDPECGKIRKSAKIFEISIYKPNDNDIDQVLTFFNQKVNHKRKNQQSKQEIKKESQNQNSNEKKYPTKNKKTKRKENHLMPYKDFSLIDRNFQPENKFLINQTMFRLTKLVKSIGQSNDILFETFEDPIQSEKSPIMNIPFENDQSFNLIYSEFECPICYDFCGLKLQLTQCGHGCCVECWKNHVISKFFSYDIKCCFNDCSQKLSLSLLKYVLPEQKFEKYQIGLKEEFLRQNFIKCPNCHSNYICLNSQYKFPKCVCGHSICINCKQESHFPISCNQYCFYLQNFGNNKKDFIMLDDVKKCPKCSSIMEKNGGCDHMRCICALNFNWSSVKSFSLVYNHKLNCLLTGNYSIDNIDPYISRELNNFRRFFLVELTPKINIKDKFLKNIVTDVNFKELSFSLTESFGLYHDNIKRFIAKVLDFIFDFMSKVCRIVEIVYARIIIKIHQNQNDQEFLKIVRRLNEWCHVFSRVLSEKLNIESFKCLIFTVKTIMKFLKKIK